MQLRVLDSAVVIATTGFVSPAIPMERDDAVFVVLRVEGSVGSNTIQASIQESSDGANWSGGSVLATASAIGSVSGVLTQIGARFIRIAAAITLGSGPVVLTVDVSTGSTHPTG